ncbi:unnamed protein product [Symbiodinium sp. KB8]|nr:unnamed protein product [Symbiodinium sp. KB8]
MLYNTPQVAGPDQPKLSHGSGRASPGAFAIAGHRPSSKRRAACDEQQVHIAVTRESLVCRGSAAVVTLRPKAGLTCELCNYQWLWRMAPPTVRRLRAVLYSVPPGLALARHRWLKQRVRADTLLSLCQKQAAEPQKVKSFASTVQPGLEHRPFSDEEIKEAFATFDLDNNRFVGAAEISHILKLIGEEEIDEMIRMCDTDGDGQVTFDEFYKMMTTPAPPLPPEVRSTKKKPYSTKLGGAKRYAKQLTESGPTSLEKATAELSKNKGDWRAQQNAAAEVSEMGNVRELLLVEQLIHKLSGGMGKIKPSQIKKIYKRFGDIDVDKSGAIDYEEFIQVDVFWF